ncbi:MAG: hypothetical protein IH940_11420, partial [Acidobacteria bacterium]|nr:hypothetical protein [Acidobacteriota bacterium]
MSLSDRLSRSRAMANKASSTSDVAEPATKSAAPPAPSLPIWKAPTDARTIDTRQLQIEAAPVEAEEASKPPIAEITQVFANGAEPAEPEPAEAEPAEVTARPAEAASRETADKPAQSLFDAGELFREMGVDPEPTNIKPPTKIAPTAAPQTYSSPTDKPPPANPPLPKTEPTIIKPAMKIAPSSAGLTGLSPVEELGPVDPPVQTNNDESPVARAETVRPSTKSESRDSLWNRLLEADRAADLEDDETTDNLEADTSDDNATDDLETNDTTDNLEDVSETDETTDNLEADTTEDLTAEDTD